MFIKIKKIIVNDLEVKFDKIIKHNDYYMILYKNKIKVVNHETDTKILNHNNILSKTELKDYKLIIFKMEWGD